MILFSTKIPAADAERHRTLTTEYEDRTPLNEYTVKVIKGTRYKVRSIYVGDKDFWQLFEDIIVTKAARRQSDRCNGGQDAV